MAKIGLPVKQLAAFGSFKYKLIHQRLYLCLRNQEISFSNRLPSERRLTIKRYNDNIQGY